ncbi:MAG: class I SAM-dependent methyltransferase [Candidatus Methanofastidiosia archaeon]
MSQRKFHREMREKFKWWVLTYDYVVAILNFFARGRLSEMVCDEVSNGRILDVCTGTGRIAIPLAEKFEKSKVYGLDISEDMLERAMSKSKYLKNMRFFKGDAREMPFKDKYFDFVTISFGLHEMRREMREEVLEEITRVLKDGGKLIIQDYDKPKSFIRKVFYYPILKFVEPSHIFDFLEENLENTLKGFGILKLRKKSYFQVRLITGLKAPRQNL